MSGGTLQLSEGTFSVTGAINLASYITLQGMGKATSVTTATPAINTIAVIGTQGSPLINVKVVDLYMWGNDATSDAIHYEWAHRSYIKGVEVSGFQGSGIYMLCCFFPTVNDIYVTASGKLSTTKPAIHLASNADDSTNEGSIYNIAITSCYYTPLKIDGGAHPCNTMYICGLQIEQMGASADVANCVDLGGDNNHIIGATISSAGTTKVGVANTGYANSISHAGFFQPMGTMITSTGSDLMVSDISGYGGTFVNGINLIAGADHCTLKGIHLNGAFSGFGIQVASDDNILADLELDATFNTGESVAFLLGGDNNTIVSGNLSKAISDAGSGNKYNYRVGATKYDSQLEDSPVDGNTTKAISSNWAYDHAAATTGVHGVGAGTIAKTADITATKLDDFATPDANTDLNANTTNHGLLLQATAPSATLLNVVGIGNGETAYTNKALVDSTAPADISTAASASGSQVIAARRDHVHGIAANAVTLANLATQAAQTFLANATSGAAVPTALALAEQTLMGRITSGNIAALTVPQVSRLLNLVRCDDFEWGADTDTLANSLGGLAWTVSSGTCTISTDHAYSGTRSAKFAGHASTSYASIPLTADGNYSLFMRGYKEAACTNTGIIHGNGTYAIRLKIATDGSLTYYDASHGYKEMNIVTNVALDAWFTLEIRNINWAAYTFDVYYNGALVNTAAAMDDYTSISNVIRIANNDTTVGNDFYVDDIAVIPTWFDTALVASKPFQIYAHGNMGTTETFNFTTAWKHSATADQTTCTFTFTDPGVGATLKLYLTASATCTVTYPATITWIGTPLTSLVSGKTYVVVADRTAANVYIAQGSEHAAA